MIEVPPQNIICPNVRVSAVVYFRVIAPNRSVVEVENHVLATSQTFRLPGVACSQ